MVMATQICRRSWRSHSLAMPTAILCSNQPLHPRQLQFLQHQHPPRLQYLPHQPPRHRQPTHLRQLQFHLHPPPRHCQPTHLRRLQYFPHPHPQQHQPQQPSLHPHPRQHHQPPRRRQRLRQHRSSKGSICQCCCSTARQEIAIENDLIEYTALQKSIGSIQPLSIGAIT